MTQSYIGGQQKPKEASILNKFGQKMSDAAAAQGEAVSNMHEVFRTGGTAGDIQLPAVRMREVMRQHLFSLRTREGFHEGVEKFGRSYGLSEEAIDWIDDGMLRHPVRRFFDPVLGSAPVSGFNVRGTRGIEDNLNDIEVWRDRLLASGDEEAGQFAALIPSAQESDAVIARRNDKILTAQNEALNAATDSAVGQFMLQLASEIPSIVKDPYTPVSVGLSILVGRFINPSIMFHPRYKRWLIHAGLNTLIETPAILANIESTWDVHENAGHPFDLDDAIFQGAVGAVLITLLSGLQVVAPTATRSAYMRYKMKVREDEEYFPRFPEAGEDAAKVREENIKEMMEHYQVEEAQAARMVDAPLVPEEQLQLPDSARPILHSNRSGFGPLEPYNNQRISMYSKLEDDAGVFLLDSSLDTASEKAAKNMGSVAAEFRNLLGIKSKIGLSITSGTDTPFGSIRGATYLADTDDAFTFMEIGINIQQPFERSVESLFHELAHLAVYEHYSALPRGNRQALREAYQKFFVETVAGKKSLAELSKEGSSLGKFPPGAPPTRIDGSPAQPGDPVDSLYSQAYVRYILDYHEWLARGLVRYLTTDDKAITLAEKLIFKEALNLRDKLKGSVEALPFDGLDPALKSFGDYITKTKKTAFWEWLGKRALGEFEVLNIRQSPYAFARARVAEETADAAPQAGGTVTKADSARDGAVIENFSSIFGEGTRKWLGDTETPVSFLERMSLAFADGNPDLIKEIPKPLRDAQRKFASVIGNDNYNEQEFYGVYSLLMKMNGADFATRLNALRIATDDFSDHRLAEMLPKEQSYVLMVDEFLERLGFENYLDDIEMQKTVDTFFNKDGSVNFKNVMDSVEDDTLRETVGDYKEWIDGLVGLDRKLSEILTNTTDAGIMFEVMHQAGLDSTQTPNTPGFLSDAWKGVSRARENSEQQAFGEFLSNVAADKRFLDTGPPGGALAPDELEMEDVVRGVILEEGDDAGRKLLESPGLPVEKVQNVYAEMMEGEYSSAIKRASGEINSEKSATEIQGMSRADYKQLVTTRAASIFVMRRADDDLGARLVNAAPGASSYARLHSLRSIMGNFTRKINDDFLSGKISKEKADAMYADVNAREEHFLNNITPSRDLGSRIRADAGTIADQVLIGILEDDSLRANFRSKKRTDKRILNRISAAIEDYSMDLIVSDNPFRTTPEGRRLGTHERTPSVEASANVAQQQAGAVIHSLQRLSQTTMRERAQRVRALAGRRFSQDYDVQLANIMATKGKLTAFNDKLGFDIANYIGNQKYLDELVEVGYDRPYIDIVRDAGEQYRKWEADNRAAYGIKTGLTYYVPQNINIGKVKGNIDKWIDYLFGDNRLKKPLIDHIVKSDGVILTKEIEIREYLKSYMLIKDKAGVSEFGSLIPSNLRHLRFVDVEAQLAHHQAYGRGNTLDMLVAKVMTEARNYGITSKFGQRPLATFDLLADVVERAVEESLGLPGSPKEAGPGFWKNFSDKEKNKFRKKVRRKFGKSRKYLETIVGQNSHLLRPKLALLSDILSGIQTAGRLGSASGSAIISDNITMGKMVASTKSGKLEGAWSGIEYVFGSLWAGRATRRERADFLAQTGVLAHTMARSALSRGHGLFESAGQSMDKYLAAYFDFSGLSYVTKRHRERASWYLLTRLADKNLGLWNKGNDGLIQGLQDFGVSGDDMKVVKSFMEQQRKSGGRDDAFDLRLLEDSPVEQDREIAERVRNFIDAYVERSVPSGGVITQGWQRGFSAHGTVKGVAARNALLWMSFGMSTSNQVVRDVLQAHGIRGKGYVVGRNLLLLGMSGAMQNLAIDSIRGHTHHYEPILNGEADADYWGRFMIRSIIRGAFLGVIGDYGQKFYYDAKFWTGNTVKDMLSILDAIPVQNNIIRPLGIAIKGLYAELGIEDNSWSDEYGGDKSQVRLTKADKRRLIDAGWGLLFMGNDLRFGRMPLLFRDMMLDSWSGGSDDPWMYY